MYSHVGLPGIISVLITVYWETLTNLTNQSEFAKV